MFLSPSLTRKKKKKEKKKEKEKTFRLYLVGRMETREDTQSWEHRKDFYFSPYVFD
jgi:hypothetical protein